MARGTTLNELVTMVREETGQSTSAALGRNSVEAVKHKIRRQQRVLWRDWDWPHLRVQREVVMQAGERYYNLPDDLSRHHRIISVAIKDDDTWKPVNPGISLRAYNWLDPDKDQRQDPVTKWDLFDREQIEVWPLPKSNGGRLLIEGIRNLRPLVADSDRADLDDELIVLYLAAEIGARQNQADAQAKLSMAQRLYKMLKGETSYQRRFSIGDRNPYRDGRRAAHRAHAFGPRQDTGEH